MKRQVITGTPWEETGGYCRAMRIGNIIEVAGTTAMDGGKLMFKNDIEGQTRFIFTKIIDALEKLEGSLNDVVRTRMFITDMKNSDKVVKVHGEFFKAIKPVSSLIGVNQLIDADLLIEIEATAIIEYSQPI